VTEGGERQTVADPEEMTLQVHPGSDDDAGELAELTVRLRAELLELDVAGAEQLPVGDVPARAKGGVAAIAGWLAVQLGPEALRTVLARIADWAARNDRSVEVTYGTDTIKLDRLSREQQDRFIDDWLARHHAGG
jgi:hypothetical protein